VEQRVEQIVVVVVVVVVVPLVPLIPLILYKRFSFFSLVKVSLINEGEWNADRQHESGGVKGVTAKKSFHPMSGTWNGWNNYVAD